MKKTKTFKQNYEEVLDSLNEAVDGMSNICESYGECADCPFYVSMNEETDVFDINFCMMDMIDKKFRPQIEDAGR